MAEDARDSDAAWRDLVAHYTAPDAAADAQVPWPARENLPRPGEAQDKPGRPDGGDGADPTLADQPPPGAADPVPGVIPAPPQIRIIRPANPILGPGNDLAGTGDEPAPAGDDEHFVPPVPPPLPRLDPVSKGAWAALFGGPAYLLLAIMAGWRIPSWAAFCAVAAFVGGFATLVVRMPDRPPTDSGPDNGAVV
jgi:hypothetical protein